MKTYSAKILSIAVIVLLLVNVGLLFFILKEKNAHNTKSQPANSGPFETMVRELNMDDQQTQEYKKMRDAHLAEIKPLFDSVGVIRKTFLYLIQEPDVDDSALGSYSRRIAEKQAQIDKLTLNYLRKVRTLFSGDQQKKFDDLMQKTMLRRNNNQSKKDSTIKK